MKAKSSSHKAAVMGQSASVWIEERIYVIPTRHWKATNFLLKDGKVIYVARNKKNHFIVWGDWESPHYDYVSYFIFGEDGLYFRVQHDGREYDVGVDPDMQVRELNEGHQKGHNTPRSWQPFIMEGTPLRIVERGGSRDPHFGNIFGTFHVIMGDWESPPYDRIDAAVIADGKPLFYGMSGKLWYVVWGDCISDGYNGVKQPMILHGKPMFIGSRSREEDRRGHLHSISTEFIVHGNREGKSYECIGGYSIVDGRPLYAARGNGAWRIVWGDEESKPYGSIFSFEIIDDMISFGARKGRYIYNVTRKIGD